MKLTQIGDSVGLILPKELLARLNVEIGDSVYATEATDGVCLSSDPIFEPHMELARKIMESRRDVLQELAK